MGLGVSLFETKIVRVLFPRHRLLCQFFEDASGDKLAQEGGAFLLVVYVGREHEFVHALFADSEEILSGNTMLLHDLGRGFVEAN